MRELSVQEFEAGPEKETKKSPKVIPLSEWEKPNKVMYDPQTEKTYSYPNTMDEDQVNQSASVELQDKEDDEFFLSVPVNKTIGVVNKGIDLLRAAGAGGVSFGVSASMRTLGGNLVSRGEMKGRTKPTLLRTADMIRSFGTADAVGIFNSVREMGKDYGVLKGSNDGVDKALIETGNALINKSSEILANEFFETEGMAEKIAFDIGGAGASLATALGATWVTGSPHAASVLFGEIAKSEMYLRARAEGKSPDESLMAGWQAFVVEGGLEYMGLDAFTQTLKGSKTFARIGFKMLTEFTQEFSQELGGEIVAKINGLETGTWEEIGMQALYSGAIGMITGGVGGAVQVMKENKALVGEWRRAGFNDEEIGIAFERLAAAEAQKRDIQRMYLNKLAQGRSELEDKKYVRGKEPLTDQEKSGRIDPKVSRALKAQRLSDAEAKEKPTGIDTKEAEAVPGANLALKGRLAKLDENTKVLEDERQALVDEQEKRRNAGETVWVKPFVKTSEVSKTLKKRKMVGETDAAIEKRLEKIDNDLFDIDVERLGLELGPLFSAEGSETKPTVKVSLKAGVLETARIAAMRKQIEKYNAGVREGRRVGKREIQMLQRYVRNLIDESGVLNDTQKKRMLASLPNINKMNSSSKIISALEAKIGELEDENLNAIFKEASYNVLKKASKSKKLDADTKDLFNRLIKLSKEKGLDPRKFQEAFEEGDIETVLNYDISVLDQISTPTEVLKQVYFDLQELFDRGINDLRAEKKAIKEAKAKAKDTFIKEISGKEKALKHDLNNPRQIKKIKSGKKTILTGDLGMSSRLKILSRNSGKAMGKSFIENHLNMFEARQVKELVYQLFGPRLKEATQRIFGLKNLNEVQAKWVKDMGEEYTVTWEIEKPGTAELDENGQPIEGTAEVETMALYLTRAQLRKKWMEWQRKAGRKTLENKHGYTEDTISGIQEILTSEDMAFIKEQFSIYSELYELMSPLYKYLTGKSLPFEAFYSHLFTEGQQNPRSSAVDIMAAQGGQQGLFDSALTDDSMFKKATGGSSGLRSIPDIFALEKYIQDVSYFMGYAELTKNMEEMFKDKDVRANIENYFGKEMLDGIDFEVHRFLKGGVDYDSNPSFKWLQDFSMPVIKAYLSNPTVGVKQLVSFLAYSGEMDNFNFVEGLMDFPRAVASGDITKLMSTIFIQARKGSATFERELKYAKQLAEEAENLYSKGSKIKFFDFMLNSMKLGDRAAIYLGGWALFKYDTEVLKISEKEALDHFVDFSNNTQQSTDVDQLPPVLASRNPVMRLHSLFKQARYQYINAMRVAIANRHREGAKPLETAKRIILMHSVMPMLFQFVASGFRFDLPEQLRAAVLGHYNDLVILGSWIGNTAAWVIAKVMEEENPQWYDDSNLVGSVSKSWKKVMDSVAQIEEDGGLDFEDTMKFIKEAATVLAPVGGTVSGAIRYGTEVAKGIDTALDGEYVDAMKHAFGYSSYIVDKGE